MQDYFNFFDVPRAFNIDNSALRKKYILNSKRYHPDFHTLESQADQDDVLRLSTLNNEAYKVLSDDRKRTLHLLKLEHVMPEEGKAQVPQDFLIEMMDVNESIMDAKMSEDESAMQKLEFKLHELEGELSSAGQSSMDSWDVDPSQSKLELIRDVYLKQQYLRRLQDQLHGRSPEM